MSQLTFIIQGSQSEPYTVIVSRRPNGNITTTCTCPAGEREIHCKHRIRLLLGDCEGLVGGNESDVATVSAWVRGSDIETILVELLIAEQECERLTMRIKQLKRDLAEAMED